VIIAQIFFRGAPNFPMKEYFKAVAWQLISGTYVSNFNFSFLLRKKRWRKAQHHADHNSKIPEASTTHTKFSATIQGAQPHCRHWLARSILTPAVI